MKHLVIGTAGHIDHGKTALIRALTGTDTDRLAEEKRRGITIDLGFAQLSLPGEIQASIIDVPGHAHYVKNMLAGACAVDLALLVVSAEEGVMPQTREHLAILSLLGVVRGIVALTKCDLADEETLELVREDCAASFAGTFLEHAPVAPLSATTGAGIPELLRLIGGIAAEIPPRPVSRPLFLPIDRVFTMQGFGTVVTGTLLDGQLRQGDTVLLSPVGEQGRVRGLQSGGREISTAVAGQRVAVNLTGIKKELLSRGGALSQTLRSATLLDVKLCAHAISSRGVAHGARLHLALGAASVVCRVSLLGRAALAPGESCFAQLRLETPVAARRGDRFVVRFYSPLETVGGGIVLDAAPQKHRRLDNALAQGLHCYETGSPCDWVLAEASRDFLTRAALYARLDTLSDAEFSEAVSQLLEKKRLVKAGELLLTPEALDREACRLASALAAYHAAHPLSDGMALSELRRLLPEGLPDYFADVGAFSRRGGAAALPAFSPLETAQYQTCSAEIAVLYEDAGCSPPESASLPKRLGAAPEQVTRVLELMVSQGRLVRVTPELHFSCIVYDAVRDFVRTAASRPGGVTLSRLRDEFATSRRYAQALLEHFDAVGLTVKLGDTHVISDFGGA